MTGETEINDEGAGLWVHACSEHDVQKLLLLVQVVSVIDDSVVENLSYEADWGLSAVLVNVWHVQVIQVVDQGLAWWGTVGSTSTLVYLRHDYSLKGLGVSVGVEVVVVVDCGVWVHGGEVVSHDGGLTGTGSTDVQDTLSSSDVEVEEESLSGGLSCWDDQVLEEAIEALVHGLDTG